MSSPIPRRLLPHKAVLSVYEGTVNSVKSYADPVDISFVRFEAVKQTAMTGLGESKNDRYIMFFDCVNSRPLGIAPKKLDKIEFDGAALVVRVVTACYGRGESVHHYEAQLV